MSHFGGVLAEATYRASATCSGDIQGGHDCTLYITYLVIVQYTVFGATSTIQ